MATDGSDRPRSWGATWPANAMTEAELYEAHVGAVGQSATMAQDPGPADRTPAPAAVSTSRGSRRPTRLRPGDRQGPLSLAIAGDRGGRAAGAPVRLVIYAPGPAAIRPWLVWMRSRGWHLHSAGRCTYAHDPRRADLPGWLVGFAVDGEPRPEWIRYLEANRTGPRRRHARARLEVVG